MITTCTGCQTRYRLEAAKVPSRLINVRCPRCQSVFLLDGTQSASAPEQDDALVIERASDSYPFAQGGGTAGVETAADPVTATGRDSSPSAASVDTVVRPAVNVSSAVTEEPVQPEAPPSETGSARRRGRSRDKAHMLARALVSDILVYNQEARDQALREGKLLEVLGPEIKKSWELYKEKVTPEVANNTNHFRDALNEILAEGEKLF
ncbi:MAG: zinc-ribbon domain-containing protein [bacterium]